MTNEESEGADRLPVFRVKKEKGMSKKNERPIEIKPLY